MGDCGSWTWNGRLEERTRGDQVKGGWLAWLGTRCAAPVETLAAPAEQPVLQYMGTTMKHRAGL
jgi:hypothetical protein